MWANCWPILSSYWTVRRSIMSDLINHFRRKWFGVNANTLYINNEHRQQTVAYAEWRYPSLFKNRHWNQKIHSEARKYTSSLWEHWNALYYWLQSCFAPFKMNQVFWPYTDPYEQKSIIWWYYNAQWFNLRKDNY